MTDRPKSVACQARIAVLIGSGRPQVRKTAKSLGLTVPSTLLARADEVIE